VNLEGGYTYNDVVILDADSSGAKGGKKDIGVAAGYNNDNSWGLTLDETVFKGGANIANYKQADLGFKVQVETLRATKLDVAFEAKRLYHGLQLAYETERIKRNLVIQAEEHYENVLNKFGQGTVSRFDVLQSKVHVAKTIPGLVRAESEIELIKAELIKLLSFNIQDKIDIDRPLSYSLIGITEGAFLDYAYVNKPEMILKSLGIDIKKWAIGTARAGNLPTLKANATFSYRSNDFCDMVRYRNNNWTAGFTLTVPLYDGLSARAKVDEAKARYAQAQLEKVDVMEQIAVAVRQACLDLVKSEAIIVSQEESLVEAREALRLSIVGYDAGVNINLDVLDAQVSLSQVEENLAGGIYDYLMGEASLARTMGEDFLREE